MLLKNNILITGAPACGKTVYAKHLACHYLNKPSSFADYCEDIYTSLPEGYVKFIPLHEGYGYDDFVTGIEIASDNNSLRYKYAERVFVEMCKKASDDQKNNYVIILDDIDKVNIASVFGELLYALENRNCSIKLANGSTVTVPENLYIIATMNSINTENKPDYAFFRRFSVIELHSDSAYIKDPDAIKLYDQYNAIIENHIVAEYADKIRNYRLGHGLFMCSSKSELYGRIYYQVIPIIEQYSKDGIIDISSKDLYAMRKNAETAVSSASLNNNVTKKFVNGKIKKETMQTINNSFSNTMTQKFRGYPAMAIVHYFDLTWCSGLLGNNQLMIELYANTNIFKVPSLSDNTSCASFLAEESLSDEYWYKTGKLSDAAKHSLFYPTESNKNVEKPIYSINNKRYILFTGVRNESQKLSINQFSANNSASPHVSKIVYLLIYNYYRIYVENIQRQILTDPTENIKRIEKLASMELNKLKSIDGARYNIDDLYDWMKKNLMILWHGAGDVINYTGNNGIPVQLTLEGVFKVQEKNYLEIMDTMGIHQMILQGPPGTSKTYGAKSFISSLIDEGTEIADYQITQEDYENSCKGELISHKKVLWDIVQFHPSYGYEDFVRGIEVSAADADANVNTKGKVVEIRNNIEYSVELNSPPVSNIKYTSVNKILGKISKLAADAGNETKVFLIIDEINRANVATVFGELIYALEYRGQSVSTPYTVSGNSNICIPDNLYIIGTMNTADKSIGAIDYAIRRRFLFFPCLPDRKIIEKFESDTTICLKLFDTIDRLFDAYLSEDYNKDDVQVGHTYFLAKDKNEMKLRFIYQIIPILREYYKDGILICSDQNSENDDVDILSDYLVNYGKTAYKEDDLWNSLCSCYDKQEN